MNTRGERLKQKLIDLTAKDEERNRQVERNNTDIRIRGEDQRRRNESRLREMGVVGIMEDIRDNGLVGSKKKAARERTIEEKGLFGRRKRKIIEMVEESVPAGIAFGHDGSKVTLSFNERENSHDYVEVSLEDDGAVVNGKKVGLEELEDEIVRAVHRPRRYDKPVKYDGWR